MSRVPVLTTSARSTRPPHQALQDPSHFGELGHIDGFMTKLLASQASGLEQVAVDIAAACDALSQTAGRLRALAKKGQHLVQQERWLSLVSCSKEFGAIPSVDACRAELQYIGCGSAGVHQRGARFDWSTHANTLPNGARFPHTCRDAHARQAALLRAVAEAVDVSTPADDWPGVLELAAASVCVDRQRVQKAIFLVEQTVERALP